MNEKDQLLEKVLLDTQYYVYRPAEPNSIYLDGTFSTSDLKEIIRVLEEEPKNIWDIYVEPKNENWSIQWFWGFFVCYV